MTGSVSSAPPGACGLAVTMPLDLQNGFLAWQVGAGVPEHDLGQARAVAQDQEGNGLQFPAAMQPAGDRHVLADMLRQVGG